MRSSSPETEGAWCLRRHKYQLSLQKSFMGQSGDLLFLQYRRLSLTRAVSILDSLSLHLNPIWIKIIFMNKSNQLLYQLNKMSISASF